MREEKDNTKFTKHIDGYAVFVVLFYIDSNERS